LFYFSKLENFLRLVAETIFVNELCFFALRGKKKAPHSFLNGGAFADTMVFLVCVCYVNYFALVVPTSQPPEMT